MIFQITAPKRSFVQEVLKKLQEEVRTKLNKKPQKPNILCDRTTIQQFSFPQKCIPKKKLYRKFFFQTTGKL